MKRSITTMLAAGIAAAFTGHAYADNETIAVLTKNQTNPFFQAERVGAEKAAQAMHAKVLQYVPTQPDSIPEQMSQIDDVIVKKPDAIVMVPVDSKAIVPGVEKINAAKIPVVNITDHSKGGDFIAFVGLDDYTIAKETGLAMLKAMGGKGEVVIIEGVRGSLTAQDRLRGFQDAIKEFPGVQLVASQTGNYQRLQALQVMENLLQSNPNVAGVMAANDAEAIGAMDALAEVGSKALIVGINGTKEAIDAIKAGKILATGSYNGFGQGCIGMMIAIRYLRHEAVPSNVTLPTTVIDKTNLSAYDVPLDQLNCPTWDQVAK
ncbi:MAG: sugar ABC transporter substrate-binding protein [Roseiarcus sp.]|jgi:ribose transport system substrate-binding protein